MEFLLLLILLSPFAGFLILGAGYRVMPGRWTSIIGPGTVLISFITSLVLFFKDDEVSSVVYNYFSWISAGPLQIGFSLMADHLSLLMSLIVTGVGFLIHLYSTGYMKEDPGYNRFFAYMNLFVFFMLLLVLGANYPVMFIGWEGVGLCSYLLIGFWFRNQEYNNAAKKAFIMNRIGDLGFLVGMFLLFTTFGTLDYHGIFSAAASMAPGQATVTIITLLLFVGAVGKSAQIPLYTWLPDAMAGPTPVSALIHAATMVTAGIYMIVRSNILFVLSPVTMSVIGITALATALLAAVIALMQNDIKKVLAYSTVSQLGYMFVALSVGAFTGAMFHLATHAFFKALLFLGAGSVIHATGGVQDIRKMGGLRKRLPVTYATFLIGTLAIAGIPPLSGFFSKDEILAHAFMASPVTWGLLLLGALLTAFYMFRLLWLTFFNNFRGTHEQEHHLHESPRVMTVPLMILAFLATIGGMMNIPALFGGNHWLSGYLQPVLSSAAVQPLTLSHSTEWLLMGVTLVLVLLVIAWSYRKFTGAGLKLLPDEQPLPWFSRLVVNKFYVDELYEFLWVKPMLWLSGFFHRVVDTMLIDTLVNRIGSLVIRTGNGIRFIQTGNVGFYMFIMVIGTILILFLNILI